MAEFVLPTKTDAEQKIALAAAKVPSSIPTFLIEAPTGPTWASERFKKKSGAPWVPKFSYVCGKSTSQENRMAFSLPIFVFDLLVKHAPCAMMIQTCLAFSWEPLSLGTMKRFGAYGEPIFF